MGNPMDDWFIRRIVTCDEKLVHYRYPDASKRWLGPRQPAKVIVKKIGLAQSNVVSILEFWRCNSLGVCSKRVCSRCRSLFLTTGTSSWNFETETPALFNLLQQDNARPRTARTTTTEMQELGGIELLPHSAYSSDHAPSDYYIFWSIAQFLRGRNFENFEAVEVGLTKFFASKIRDWYRRGIINRTERWLKAIECDGLYLKSSLISCQKRFQIKFCLKTSLLR